MLDDPAGVTLNGVVTEPQGHGVPGVLIEASFGYGKPHKAWGWGKGSSVTDVQGRFAIPVPAGLPSGVRIGNRFACITVHAPPGFVARRVRVHADGHMYQCLRTPDRDQCTWGPVSEANVLESDGGDPPDAPWPNVTIAMRATRGIEGLMTGRDGRGVGGVRVIGAWSTCEDSEEGDASVTDPEGRFSLTVPEEVRDVEIRVECHGAFVTWTHVVPGNESIRLPAPDFTMDLLLGGYAHDLTDWDLRLRHESGASLETGSRMSEVTGRSLRVGGFLPGRYEVKFVGWCRRLEGSELRPDLGSTVCATGLVSVPGEAVSLDAEPVDEGVAAVLEGILDVPCDDPLRIMWAADRPMLEAALREPRRFERYEPFQQVVVGSGQMTFTIPRVRSVPGTLYARSPGGDTYALETGVVPGRGPARLAFLRGEAIEGFVARGPAAVVRWEGMRARRGVIYQEAPVSPSGAFRITGLPPGPFLVEYLRGTLRGVRVLAHVNDVLPGTSGLQLVADPE